MDKLISTVLGELQEVDRKLSLAIGLVDNPGLRDLIRGAQEKAGIVQGMISGSLVIRKYNKQHIFLSNRYPSPVVYDGVKYDTIEHAINAASCRRTLDRHVIRDTRNPARTHQLAQQASRVRDWDKICVDVVYSLLEQKFGDDRMKDKLLSTRPALIECHEPSKIWDAERLLGGLLMKLREEKWENDEKMRGSDRGQLTDLRFGRDGTRPS